MTDDPVSREEFEAALERIVDIDEGREERDELIEQATETARRATEAAEYQKRRYEILRDVVSSRMDIDAHTLDMLVEKRIAGEDDAETRGEADV